MDIKEKRVVNNVLFNLMGLKKGEKLLIVCDQPLYELGDLFFKGAEISGSDAVLIKYLPRQIHGQEPPSIVAKALASSDVALLITSKSLSHTKARKQASKKGVRIASLPGITYDMAMRTLSFDYRKIKRKIENCARRLTAAKKIEVKTKKGTNISFSVAKRKGFADTGIYNKKSAFGNLPPGEACIAPLEGTASGVIVVDGSIAGWGKVERLHRLYIKDGFLVVSQPEDFYKFLSQYGKNAKNLAEFGIGFNPRAKITGNVLEDEKVLNTCHFAFGTNISFGGKIDAQIHIDVVIFNPQIYLDGKLLKIGG
ncbi:MAG: aminopeptidase [Candidatus Omnitrophica bacterium]|nr:aminopeptidase [Candidatus Omnitrophota bacterium]